MDRAKEKAEKVYSIKVTVQALNSIDQITGYIAYDMHEPLNAIRVGDQIFDTINRIKRNPFAFRECEEIPTQNKIYRKAVCLSWLFIYKIRSAEVVVLDIIHGSRQPLRIKSVRNVK